MLARVNFATMSGCAACGVLGDEARVLTQPQVVERLLLRWFDHWLKDAGTFADEPRVGHFAMGANRWFGAETCSGDVAVTLHLHSAGRAESRKGDGLLLDVEAGNEPPDVFVYDPEVPVMAPGGLQATSGVFDQAVLELGNNLLVYTGEPLDEAMHVFGAPRVVLYAATSASCADLTAKLVRVTAAGRAEFCCIGIARSSFVFGEGYKVDEVQRWEFALEPTSTVFAAGERVRLEVAGCAFPLYDRNPSSGVKPSEMSPWNWGRSTHTVFHDAARPSVLKLPTIEVAA